MNNENNENKGGFGTGLLAGLFLGLIGLFIGFTLKDDEERSNFFGGWFLGVAIWAVVLIVLTVKFLPALASSYRYY